MKMISGEGDDRYWVKVVMEGGWRFLPVRIGLALITVLFEGKGEKGMDMLVLGGRSLCE